MSTPPPPFQSEAVAPPGWSDRGDNLLSLSDRKIVRSGAVPARIGLGDVSRSLPIGRRREEWATAHGTDIQPEAAWQRLHRTSTGHYRDGPDGRRQSLASNSWPTRFHPTLGIANNGAGWGCRGRPGAGSSERYPSRRPPVGMNPTPLWSMTEWRRLRWQERRWSRNQPIARGGRPYSLAPVSRWTRCSHSPGGTS